MKGMAMAKKTTRKASKPSRANERLQRRMTQSPGSGSGPSDPGPWISGSGIQTARCKFFPKGHALPAVLNLQVDAPLQGGSEPAREQLNRPTLLIHAQDAAFVCCWFSRAIDLGDDSGNPAFWMLQKTAADTWFLCLRRVTGQMAAYHLKSKIKDFPIKLKKGQVGKEFKWPATITIDNAG
jgi:hypothetical protein